MLVFIVPLKSQKNSTSWKQVCKLFERCVKSICNQTSPEFEVIVVCNEIPEIEFNHPKINYITVDFSLRECLENDSQQFLNSRRTDKGRKVLAGLVQAQAFKPTHTMFVDADDCVSNRLAHFVSQHPQQNGWFVERGYRYQDASKVIYLKRRNFYRMCGTCNIIRFDLNHLPDSPEYDRGYGYYKQYIDHGKTRKLMIEKGTPLAPLPFAGAIYITATGENLYYSEDRFYQGVFRLINYRSLNCSLRDEFGLYPLS